MAAHRFWGIDASRIGAYVSFKDIEMRSVVGGANLAPSATPYGPPNFLASPNAAAAFDGNDSTGWAWSGPEPFARLYVDFTTPVEIVEVVVKTLNYLGYEMGTVNVCWSDDGQVWTAMAPSVNVRGAAANFTITPTVDGAARAVPAPERLIPGWPTFSKFQRAGTARYDAVFGGAMRIAGTVAIDDSPDIPVSRVVRLFDKQSGVLVRQTISGPDGSYQFERLTDRKYFLVAHDHTLEYNAAIKDEITPEPMT